MKFFCSDEIENMCYDDAKTSMSYIATCLGLKTEQYISIIIDKINNGKIDNVIKEDSMDDLISWIVDSNHYQGSSVFGIRLNITEDTKDDSFLLFICSVDFEGARPYIKSHGCKSNSKEKKTIDLAEKLDVFEISLCDLKTNF